jgi:UDP-3-O-[3-hydroxymyristoyl] glucosamine N-acyltransferase
MEKSLTELAQIVQGQVIGDGNTRIYGVTSLDAPKVGCITFVENNHKLKLAEESPIAALIIPEKSTSIKKPAIQSRLPKLAWAVLLGIFNPDQTFEGGVSKLAFISNSAKIGSDVTIEPFAHIGEKVEIGDHSVIRSHAFIDQAVQIGHSSVIHPFVMIYRDTRIGNQVTIHAGSVIGTDGFGYIFDGAKQAKIPQVGNVIIEDCVEIGACSTIDRATIGSTLIRKGVKIDNLVQIAHNVEIGTHTCLSAQVGISGSSKVGNYVTMGGRVGLGDHCEVGDQVMLGAQAGLPTGKKIPAKQIWIGAPARPYPVMRKQVGAQLRSYETQSLVNNLKKRVEALEEELKAAKT